MTGREREAERDSCGCEGRYQWHRASCLYVPSAAWLQDKGTAPDESKAAGRSRGRRQKDPWAPPLASCHTQSEQRRVRKSGAWAWAASGPVWVRCRTPRAVVGGPAARALQGSTCRWVVSMVASSLSNVSAPASVPDSDFFLHQTSLGSAFFSASSSVFPRRTRNLAHPHISSLYLKNPGHPHLPSSLDFQGDTSTTLPQLHSHPRKTLLCPVREWTVAQSPVSTDDFSFGLRNAKTPHHAHAHEAGKNRSTTDRSPCSASLSVNNPSARAPALPTATIPPLSSIRSKALFMYQHDRHTVSRHSPPIGLHPFRIAWKPRCHNISSDG